MNIIRFASALVLAVLAVLACAPVTAGVTLPQITNAAGQTVPSQGAVPIDSNGNEKGTVANPSVTAAGPLRSASSAPLEGTATSSAVTPTSGTATFAGGVAYIGPLVPELGRDIRVVLKGTWAGTVQIGTASAVNGCTAGNINPLTVAGQSWGSYTANANEVVDTPSLGATVIAAAPVYCATATITSGALTYAVRQ